MIYTALITPFKEGSIDKEGFQLLLERQVKAGINGVVVAGSTGEGITLEEHEWMELVSLATKHPIHVCVSTGSPSTKWTIERTKKAKELGADSALIVPSYYNKPTSEGIFRHFEAIAEAVDLPIIVYNHPGRCSVNIDALTMRRIAQLPNIQGVKDASGNFPLMMEYIKIPNFFVLSGDDILTLPQMSVGAHGVISALSNLIPEKMKSLVGNMKEGNHTLARELHYDLLPLFQACSWETPPIPLKAAMELCGLPSGGMRLPLTDMQFHHKEKLIPILEELQLLSNMHVK